MAYDEGLADRIRDIIADDDRFFEKKMFGALAFCTGIRWFLFTGFYLGGCYGILFGKNNEKVKDLTTHY
jgi:hypothetical protein